MEIVLLSQLDNSNENDLFYVLPFYFLFINVDFLNLYKN